MEMFYQEFRICILHHIWIGGSN